MITIKIPFKTPTINHLYGYWKGRVVVKTEAKELKKKIAEIINPQLNKENGLLNKKLSIKVEIHENWFTKKGDVLRKDISNREKFLIDTIFDSLGIDDKFIFEHILKKIQDNEEYAIININIMENN